MNAFRTSCSGSIDARLRTSRDVVLSGLVTTCTPSVVDDRPLQAGIELAIDPFFLVTELEQTAWHNARRTVIFHYGSDIDL